MTPQSDIVAGETENAVDKTHGAQRDRMRVQIVIASAGGARNEFRDGIIAIRVYTKSRRDSPR